jgi:hypothetical protein
MWSNASVPTAQLLYPAAAGIRRNLGVSLKLTTKTTGPKAALHGVCTPPQRNAAFSVPLRKIVSCMRFLQIFIATISYIFIDNNFTVFSQDIH